MSVAPGRLPLPIVVALAIPAALLAAVPEAAAEHGPAAPMGAVSAPMITAPAKDAVVEGVRVRVAVRRPAASKVRIELGGRNVSEAFRTRGRKLVGRLGRADAIKRGINHLYVLAKRSGKRSKTHSRSFFLVRRKPGLARIKLGDGTPRRARIDVGSGSGLAAVRRSRQVRIWLNGKRIEQHAATKERRRHWLSLSAAHGLRHGVNTLRVRVIEPERGHSARVTKRLRVPRTKPLANAGLDRHGHEGMHVRLGGRARAARGGELSYRWEIAAKPKGSSARLIGAERARARLIPDLPGRYRLRQHVSEGRAAGGAARNGGGVARDEVTVAVTPQAALVEIAANSAAYDPRGIKVADTFHPHTGPGASLQWLTLDRATLQPTLTGNNWCCDDDEHSLQKLIDQLSCSGQPGTAGLGHLVVLTLPPNQQVLRGSDVSRLNTALRGLGVDPLPEGLIDDPEQSEVVVGVPCAGAGTGWVKRRGSGESGGLPRVGWLMPDGTTDPTGALRYRFQPERLPYDTSVSRTETTNRMVFNGHTADGQVTPTEAGFHVVEIDPRDLSIVNNNSYETNSSSPAAAIGGMTSAINGARSRGNYVAVQSIGHAKPQQYERTSEQQTPWYELGDALAAMGANPDIFNRINGSYAFFGGPPLDRASVVQSSSVNPVDPTTSPTTMEPGRLRGRARIGHDGIIVPAISSLPAGSPDGAAGLPDTLYDIVFAPSTPWPAYDPAAMRYITSKLDDLKAYAPNLRTAYLDKPSLRFSDSKTDLAGLTYPGDGTLCGTPAGQMTSNPGFTREAFCGLSMELQKEFDWIDDTHQLIDDYEEALNFSGGQQGVDLQSIGSKIEKAVEPPDTSLVAPILYLLEEIGEVGLELAEGPEGLAVSAGLAATLFDLGTTAASEANAPVGDTVKTKVEDLAHEIDASVANSASALEAIRAVAASDYGKLQKLAALYTTSSSASVQDLAGRFTTAADAYFSSTLVPTAYEAWRLQESVYDCIPLGYDTFDMPFVKAPKSSWTEFLYDYDPPDSELRTLIMIERDGYASDHIPAAVSNPMFTPVSQSGYGLNKSTFLWSLGDPYDENCDID